MNHVQIWVYLLFLWSFPFQQVVSRFFQLLGSDTLDSGLTLFLTSYIQSISKSCQFSLHSMFQMLPSRPPCCCLLHQPLRSLPWNSTLASPPPPCSSFLFLNLDVHKSYKQPIHPAPLNSEEICTVAKQN